MTSSEREDAIRYVERYSLDWADERRLKEMLGL